MAESMATATAANESRDARDRDEMGRPSCSGRISSTFRNANKNTKETIKKKKNQPKRKRVREAWGKVA